MCTKYKVAAALKLQHVSDTKGSSLKQVPQGSGMQKISLN